MNVVWSFSVEADAVLSAAAAVAGMVKTMLMVPPADVDGAGGASQGVDYQVTPAVVGKVLDDAAAADDVVERQKGDADASLDEVVEAVVDTAVEGVADACGRQENDSAVPAVLNVMMVHDFYSKGPQRVGGPGNGYSSAVEFAVDSGGACVEVVGSGLKM